MMKMPDYDEGQAVANFIVSTQIKVLALMKDEGVSRADLARRLRVSRSRVTQLFGDRPNLTAETIARLFFVLGDTAEVTSPKVQAILRHYEDSEISDYDRATVEAEDAVEFGASRSDHIDEEAEECANVVSLQRWCESSMNGGLSRTSNGRKDDEIPLAGMEDSRAA